MVGMLSVLVVLTDMAFGGVDEQSTEHGHDGNLYEHVSTPAGALNLLSSWHWRHYGQQNLSGEIELGA